MRPIRLNNEKLMTLLSTLTDICYDKKIVDLVSKDYVRKDKLIPEFYGVSDDYLKKALTLKVRDFGFPRTAHGLGMSGVRPKDWHLIEPIEDHVKKIGKFLGTHVNALTMLYPKNGFIGWHHNGNAPGYNILLSYSLDGEGDFRYWDKDKKEIVIMKDKPGWFGKVGYYPSDTKEVDRVYWHAAQTKQQRVSIAWIMPHRPMWISMIEEITNGEYDKDFILSQGNA